MFLFLTEIEVGYETRFKLKVIRLTGDLKLSLVHGQTRTNQMKILILNHHGLGNPIPN